MKPFLNGILFSIVIDIANPNITLLDVRWWVAMLLLSSGEVIAYTIASAFKTKTSVSSD